MLLNNKKIGFIGAGNMAFAIIKGLINSKAVLADQITAADPNTGKLSELNKTLDIHNFADHNVSIVKDCDIIIFAIKPQQLETVLDEIKSIDNKNKLFVSIVAGAKTEFFETFLSEAKVIRVMPNFPALISEAMSGVCGGQYATQEDLKTACEIFDAVGKTVTVSEEQLDAITGVSGSGPAFVFKFIEALSDAGVRAGLSRDNAILLAAQTVLGSAKMVLETKAQPMSLKDMVTSPGGTTIEGVYQLDKGGFSASVMDAVDAAVKRAKELGAK